MVLFVNMELVEHLLDVTRNGDRVLPEAAEYPNKTVDQVWSNKQVVIQRLILEPCGTIKDNSDFLLAWMVDRMMWNVPWVTAVCVNCFLSIATLDRFLHEVEVVFPILCVPF